MREAIAGEQIYQGSHTSTLEPQHPKHVTQATSNAGDTYQNT